MHVFIATPCYNDQVYTGYFESMIKLTRLCDTQGIKITTKTISGESLITRARNYLAAEFMGNKEYTHLMFIDSDITFKPESVIDLLKSGKDIIGGCYPIKRFEPEKFAAKIIKHSEKLLEGNANIILASTYNYAVNPLETDEKKIISRLVKVKNIATGFLMISKRVFERLKELHPDKKYINNHLAYDNEFTRENFYNFFDCIIHPADKIYLSEDYSFCYTCKCAGFDIWADLGINLCHSGLYNFSGSYVTTYPHSV